MEELSTGRKALRALFWSVMGVLAVIAVAGTVLGKDGVVRAREWLTQPSKLPRNAFMPDMNAAPGEDAYASFVGFCRFGESYDLREFLKKRNLEPQTERAKTFLAQTDAWLRSKGEKTLLFLLAQRGASFPYLVEDLVKMGADPNMRDVKGNTPLHIAAEHEAGTRLIVPLMDSGALWNVRNDAGFSPIEIVLATGGGMPLEMTGEEKRRVKSMGFSQRGLMGKEEFIPLSRFIHNEEVQRFVAAHKELGGRNGPSFRQQRGPGYTGAFQSLESSLYLGDGAWGGMSLPENSGSILAKAALFMRNMGTDDLYMLAKVWESSFGKTGPVFANRRLQPDIRKVIERHIYSPAHVRFFAEYVKPEASQRAGGTLWAFQPGKLAEVARRMKSGEEREEYAKFLYGLGIDAYPAGSRELERALAAYFASTENFFLVKMLLDDPQAKLRKKPLPSALISGLFERLAKSQHEESKKQYGAILTYLLDADLIDMTENVRIERDPFPILGAAVEARSFAVTEKLLEKGADPNILYTYYDHAESGDRNKKGTALHALGRGKYYERNDESTFPLAELLVQYGADVTIANSAGRVPLLEGTASKRLDELFWGATPEVRAKTCPPNAFLLMHARRAAVRVPILTKRGADINARDASGQTPLYRFLANTYGDSYDFDQEYLKSFLDAGADVHAATKHGYTPLSLIVIRQHVNAFTLLMERGVKLPAMFPSGETPLGIIVRSRDRDEIIPLLLARGAAVNAKDKNGDMPLHIAVRHDRLKLFQRFLESGADISARNAKGETPLHVFFTRSRAWSASDIRLRIFEGLMLAGADEAAKNTKGQTSYGVCVANVHKNDSAEYTKRRCDDLFRSAEWIRLKRQEEKAAKK